MGYNPKQLNPDDPYGVRDSSELKKLIGWSRNFCKSLYDKKGTTEFVTSGAPGIDQLVFLGVEELKREYPEIGFKNILMAPYENQDLLWTWKDGFFNSDFYRKSILPNADEVHYYTSNVDANAKPQDVREYYSTNRMALHANATNQSDYVVSWTSSDILNVHNSMLFKQMMQAASVNKPLLFVDPKTAKISANGLEQVKQIVNEYQLTLPQMPTATNEADVANVSQNENHFVVNFLAVTDDYFNYPQLNQQDSARVNGTINAATKFALQRKHFDAMLKAAASSGASFEINLASHGKSTMMTKTFAEAIDGFYREHANDEQMLQILNNQFRFNFFDGGHSAEFALKNNAVASKVVNVVSNEDAIEKGIVQSFAASRREPWFLANVSDDIAHLKASVDEWVNHPVYGNFIGYSEHQRSMTRDSYDVKPFAFIQYDDDIIGRMKQAFEPSNLRFEHYDDENRIYQEVSLPKMSNIRIRLINDILRGRGDSTDVFNGWNDYKNIFEQFLATKADQKFMKTLFDTLEADPQTRFLKPTPVQLLYTYDLLEFCNDLGYEIRIDSSSGIYKDKSKEGKETDGRGLAINALLNNGESSATFNIFNTDLNKLGLYSDSTKRISVFEKDNLAESIEAFTPVERAKLIFSLAMGQETINPQQQDSLDIRVWNFTKTGGSDLRLSKDGFRQLPVSVRPQSGAASPYYNEGRAVSVLQKLIANAQVVTATQFNQPLLDQFASEYVNPSEAQLKERVIEALSISEDRTIEEMKYVYRSIMHFYKDSAELSLSDRTEAYQAFVADTLSSIPFADQLAADDVIDLFEKEQFGRALADVILDQYMDDYSGNKNKKAVRNAVRKEALRLNSDPYIQEAQLDFSRNVMDAYLNGETTITADVEAIADAFVDSYPDLKLKRKEAGLQTYLATINSLDDPHIQEIQFVYLDVLYRINRLPERSEENVRAIFADVQESSLLAKSIDFEPLLQNYADENFNDLFRETLVDGLVGNYEEGFNANLLNRLPLDRSIGQGMSRNNYSTLTILTEAIRSSGYDVTKLKALSSDDKFFNSRLIDYTLQFDATTARGLADLAPEGENRTDDYYRKVIQMVNDELVAISEPARLDSKQASRARRRFTGKDGANDFNVKIDAYGVVRWEGQRHLNGTGQNRNMTTSYDVYGEIGQIFVPDENGVIRTNFKGKENFGFIPAYTAYYLTNDGLSEDVSENLRLKGFDQLLPEKIRAVLRNQVFSDFQNQDDVDDVYRLSGANNATALNNVMYRVGDDGMYGTRIDLDLLTSPDEENVAHLSDELLQKRLQMYASAVRFPNSYMEESNSLAYHAYEEAYEVVKKEIFATNPDLTPASILRTLVDNQTLENPKRVQLLIDHIEADSTFNDDTFYQACLVSEGQEALTEMFGSINGVGPKTISSVQSAVKDYLSEMVDTNIVENLATQASGSFRNAGMRNARVIDVNGFHNKFDPMITPVGANQGLKLYLAEGAKVAEDGRLIAAENPDYVPGDALTAKRAPIINTKLFEHSKNDSFVRVDIGVNSFMHAIGVDMNTKVMFASANVFNTNDGVVVVKKYAERNRVPALDIDGNVMHDEDGKVVYRDLMVGDKSGDAHGNKGVIGTIVDPDMSDEEAAEKGLLELVQLVRANPEVDVLLSPYSFISRKNAGTLMDGLVSERQDGYDPFTGKVLPNAIVSIPTVVLEQTVDRQTKIYGDDPSRGRHYSGQAIWIAESADVSELPQYFLSGDKQLERYQDLREYFISMGLDISETGELQLGYHPHDGEERHIFKTSAFMDEHAFLEEIRNRGGFLELPFEFEFITSQTLNAELDKERGTKYQPFTDLFNAYDGDVKSDFSSNLLPILPYALRKSISFADGTSSDHDYTKAYYKIYKDVRSYFKKVNDSEYVRAKERFELAGEEGVKPVQLRDVESLKENIQEEITKLQRTIMNKVLDPDHNGKHSYFRDFIMRRRMDNSTTAVLTANPTLDLDTVQMGRDMMESMGLEEGDAAIIFRDPLLNDGSTRLVYVTEGDSNVIAFNPVLAESFEADHDGDNLGAVKIDGELLDKVERRLGVPWNLVNYGAGLEDGKYPLYLLADGTDYSMIYKKIAENPERYAEEQMMLDKMDEMRSETFTLVHDDGSVSTHPNNVEEMRRIADDASLRELYLHQYYDVVNEFFKRTYAMSFDASHVYDFTSADTIMETTQRIVDDKAKGKPEDVDSLKHYLTLDDHQFVNDANKDQMVATGFKTDLTGLAGSMSQSLVNIVRGYEGYEDAMKAVLEVTKRPTQGTVSLKNKGDEGKKVERALNNFRQIMQRPTMLNLSQIKGENLPVEVRKQYARQPLTVAQLHEGLNLCLADLGKVNDKYVHKVATLFVNPKERFKYTPETIDSATVVGLNTLISNGTNTMDKVAYSGDFRHLLRSSLLAEGTDGKRLTDGNRLVKDYQPKALMERVDYAKNNQQSLVNFDDSNELEKPEPLQLYHKQTQKVHLVDVDERTNAVAYHFNKLNHGFAESLLQALEEHANTKADVVNLTREHLLVYQTFLQDKLYETFLSPEKTETTLTYQQLQDNSSMFRRLASVGNIDQALSDNALGAVSTFTPTKPSLQVWGNDFALHQFAESLIKDGDRSFKPIIKLDDKGKKMKSEGQYVYDDPHANNSIDLEAIQRLRENGLGELNHTYAGDLLKTLFSEFGDAVSYSEAYNQRQESNHTIEPIKNMKDYFDQTFSEEVSEEIVLTSDESAASIEFDDFDF